MDQRTGLAEDGTGWKLDPDPIGFAARRLLHGNVHIVNEVVLQYGLSSTVKRILFLTQGDQQTASSRHRVYQFIPLLEKAGWEVIVSPAVTTEEYRNTFLNRDVFSRTR